MPRVPGEDAKPAPWETDELREVARAETTATVELAAANRELAIQQLLGQDAGRKWVAEYLASLGIFSAHVPAEALIMAEREGMRKAGLRFLSYLWQYAPQLLSELLAAEFQP